jgi:Tropinone reductase 1
MNGSCLCGRVRYKIDGELGDFGYCHCASCRKASGSAHAANAPVDRARFTLVSGAGVLCEFESSPGKLRAFCSACGSPIYAYLVASKNVLRIRLGSLDSTFDKRPRAHTWVSDKASWETIADGLPQFATWAAPQVLEQRGTKTTGDAAAVTPPLTWHLAGKRALVTGATKGIGRAVADELVTLGASVLVVARSEADVVATVAELAPRGQVAGVAADITIAADRARIVEAARARGSLHVLVHNAGTNVRAPLVAYDDATIERLIALDLTAPLELSRDLHPLLRDAGGASVIHVGSVAGQLALPTGVAYAAAKAGLAQAARTLALEWAKDGIRVNTVAPWYTRTPLVEPVLARPEAVAAIVARTPLGRIAEPREVAAAIAFLAMDAASYITGQCLSVDGGMSIQGLPTT